MKLQQQSSSCSSRSDYRTIYIKTFHQNAIKERSRGLMDKALPSGGKDCEFESCRDRFFLPFFPFVPGTAAAGQLWDSATAKEVSCISQKSKGATAHIFQ